MRAPDRLGPPPGRALVSAAVTAALLALGFRPRRFAAGHVVHRELDAPQHERVPPTCTRPAWKDIPYRLYQDIGTDRVVALAAGVTFYSILALFPALAALVALYGLFADPQTIAGHLNSLSGILPGGALQVLGGEMQRIAGQGGKTLGLTFIVGLATALWSANAGIKALFDALNIVYKEPEKRSFIMLNAVSLLFTAAIIGFVLLAMAALVVLPIALNYFGMAHGSEDILTLARWPALLIIVMLGLSLLYRFGPSRTNPKWRWITWGSAFAAVAWLAVSVLFSWYAANFGSYNKTYGSLGAVIGFMVWIWLSSMVMLIGGEVDSELEETERPETDRSAPLPPRCA
jgi:membrane protein